jgi:glyoxylase I family protein
MSATERSIGLLVDDLAGPVQELLVVGTEVDAEVSGNARERYVHFRAPDGLLYELVERRLRETGRVMAASASPCRVRRSHDSPAS